MERVPQHTKKFASIEEELQYLRERVSAHEQTLGSGEHTPHVERLIRKEIKNYAATPDIAVLKHTYTLPEYQSTGMALGLEKENHDVQVDELIKLMTTHGIKNALTVAARIGPPPPPPPPPHLDDDFHRVLVQYVIEGLPTKGLKAGSEEWRALHQTLYEVSLPSERDDESGQKELEKILKSMEQLYAGMRSITEGGTFARKNVFTVEIAVAQGSEHAIFYVSVPRDKKNMFEKHILSIYPGARLVEQKNDYNVFNENGYDAGAYVALGKHGIFPIKVYKEFQHDPMNIVLAAFSKLKKHSEGAALQIVIGNDGDEYNHRYKTILDDMRKGDSVHHAIKKSDTFFGSFMIELQKVLFPSNNHNKNIDQTAIEQVTKKISSRIVPACIRIVASAGDKRRAEEIISELASTFNQFDEAQGNHFIFKLQKGQKLVEFLRSFTFRSLTKRATQALSIEELTTLVHLTASGVSTSRELKSSKAKQNPAPVGLPEDGIVLGYNTFGAGKTDIHFGKKDRVRHSYVIGQTGTGKSVLLKNMIIQDIRNGDGVCYIDPHGSDIIDILAAVPPERLKDVIYFDPSYSERPMGLNMMEYDPKYPEQKTFVVNEILSIFEKLFGQLSPESLGPMFQQYFRNGAMLALEGQPAGTATLADIPRVLANGQFRRELLKKSKNPIINQFWTEVAEKAGGDASLENVVPYITSKTDIFLANDIMRPIIAQPQSSFNFRDIMDTKKIFLVNLSKGRLGDLNAGVLGLFIVGKITQAALSRADSQPGTLPVFYLYIDEFQNFTTPSISVILSEARKYGLALTVAHQFIKQLDEKIRDAVFGNVGTKMVFRVGVEDAEFLEKSLKPSFQHGTLLGLDNYNAYISLLADGQPTKPFNIVGYPPFDVDYSKVDAVKQHSYEVYGRDKAEVEAEIQSRYMPAPQKEDPFAQF